jgi:hypothetical protein
VGLWRPSSLAGVHGYADGTVQRFRELRWHGSGSGLLWGEISCHEPPTDMLGGLLL